MEVQRQINLSKFYYDFASLIILLKFMLLIITAHMLKNKSAVIFV